MKTIYENLNEEIRELEDLLTERTEWDQIPQSDFSINVGREDKFLFEIRPKEQCHYEAHFHVKSAEKSGSYRIQPASKIISDFTNKEDKIIISWADKHKQKLIETWNILHENKRIECVKHGV